MSDETPNPDEQTAHQGAVADAADPDQLRKAIELALDFRGDVTITRKSGGRSIEGYIFDRKDGPTPAEASIRIIPSDADERLTIRCDDIARLEFSGRDTAAGKSFETWMKKYVEKKLAGEQASIEAESLDN
ncbi:MAG: hypothetical protein ACYSU7_07490 [Planctomycetota bacterium]